ncbi:porphobilinogen deaminase, dipyromethane cofactor binding domain-containing protein [Diplogelasinospora grovesii]|uniref:Porphobilinogen deaminase n=1 Tax=Diplogelasinospora grovesii TaxID=303347 RepID=A0AAN6S9U2_9PEZI|nr:porphobilinogen deaminase, dipyromethane cofactor binding domain-containing protein [Diplogelasinospora grovesii]
MAAAKQNEGKKEEEEEGYTIRVGTRRSALALKQAELVISSLSSAHPHVNFEVHAMATMGDRDKTTPLPEMGKGLWTSELEAKLVAKEVDIIVHSLKDMPTTLPSGCLLGCVTKREDPRDVVIFKEDKYKTLAELAELKEGAVVGTSSVRRAAQLRRRYPGLKFKDVRGNIDTRLKKLDDPENGLDCIILAAAGLLRMDFGDRIGQYLESSTEGGGLLHAVGQGALGIECREDDERVLGLLKSIEHTPTMMAAFAERSVMRTLEGGCSVPIGVETSWVEGEDTEEEGEGESKGGRKLRIRAIVVSLDGTEGVDGEKVEEVASLAQADSLGKKMAQELVDKGAQKILDVINNAREGHEGAGAVKVGDVSK